MRTHPFVGLCSKAVTVDGLETCATCAECASYLFLFLLFVFEIKAHRTKNDEHRKSRFESWAIYALGLLFVADVVHSGFSHKVTNRLRDAASYQMSRTNEAIQDGVKRIQDHEAKIKELVGQLKDAKQRLADDEYRNDLISTIQLTLDTKWTTKWSPKTEVAEYAINSVPIELRSSADRRGVTLASGSEQRYGQSDFTTSTMVMTYSLPPDSPLIGKPFSALSVYRYVRSGFCEGVGSVVGKSAAVTARLTVNGLALPPFHGSVDCSGPTNKAPRNLDISSYTTDLQNKLHALAKPAGR